MTDLQQFLSMLFKTGMDFSKKTFHDNSNKIMDTEVTLSNQIEFRFDPEGNLKHVHNARPPKS